MKLNQSVFDQKDLWEKKGYAVPRFDRKQAAAATASHPVWLHIGAGNIFRAFQAHGVQKLLNAGLMDTGLIVAESYDPEIIERIYRPYDNMSILVTLKADGSMDKCVIGSVMESLCMTDDMGRLRSVFASPSLQLVSLTITEKGYQISNGDEQLLAPIARDMECGPDGARTTLGMLVALLFERFNQGAYPLALVSMDNCSHNGQKLRDAVLVIAKGWADRDFVPETFLTYISAPEKISFPWTMIDKITPRPDPSLVAVLEADGVEEMICLETAKHTFIGTYVNAESCEYLMIEDSFPNGRPPLEAAGFILTDRKTVNRGEQMKVCTCLNPLHTALAVFGCLLGKKTIAQAMADVVLRKLVMGIGYDEGLPVAEDPGVLSPKQFLDDVVYRRLVNPFIPDTPARIATDTSQKLSVRFGKTIRAYMNDSGKGAGSLKLIPLVFAGWLRYLMGTDDDGRRMTLSPDPRLEELTGMMKKLENGKVGVGTEMSDAEISTGGEQRYEALLRPILTKTDIWGVDLYEAGLVPEIVSDFMAMTAGPGAVYAWLKRKVED